MDPVHIPISRHVWDETKKDYAGLDLPDSATIRATGQRFAAACNDAAAAFRSLAASIDDEDTPRYARPTSAPDLATGRWSG